MKTIIQRVILFFSLLAIHVQAGYDPNIQRWINQDPIGEQGGINPYGFVGNNPISNIDPLGLDITVINPNAGHYVFGHDGPEPMMRTIITKNPPWLDFLYDATSFPGNGTVCADFEGPVLQEAESVLAKLMAQARKMYPKKCGKFEDHHIDPQYMGGNPKGPTVSLEAPYHQLITNEFRQRWPYGQAPPPLNIRENILNTVYSKLPLPK